MCGIVGLFRSSVATDSFQSELMGMISTLDHRGPDDHGSWIDSKLGVGLGHRRLAVIDLSPLGHQPMLSACSRYVMVFNGEIYNHLELRKELEKAGVRTAWRGHSDTETLLSCIVAWGLRKTLDHAVGMFALALWDRQEQRLSLARDRLGEKPLYYGWFGGMFGFASELKALREHAKFQNSIDRNALDLYFQYSYVPSPYSIYRNIYKLEPGCILSSSLQDLSRICAQALRAPHVHDSFKIERFWSLEHAVRNAQSEPIDDEAHAIERLEKVLRESIQLQCIADVPLGAFLSGGIDSSTIVALMQTQTSQPIQTYTIGFEEAEYNEAQFASAVAQSLGTDHFELTLTEKDAQNVIPALPGIYSEPFADSSQIPTHLVARMASSSVKVALSGDAGDELFGGYNRYVWAHRVWKMFGPLPAPARYAICALLQGIPKPVLNLMGTGIKVNRLSEKVSKLIERLNGAESIETLYKNLVSEWASQSLVLRSEPLPTALDLSHWVETLGPTEERMMAWDTLTYLPDDILHKVDRASMAVSLEARAPFLDHRVVEFAWRLPLSMKIRNGHSKWALRQVLYKHVPTELIDRPKTGFALPIGDWLRGPLKDWAADLLDPAKLESQGYLNTKLIQDTWAEHLKGSRDCTSALWSVLMYQAWFEAGA